MTADREQLAEAALAVLRSLTTRLERSGDAAVAAPLHLALRAAAHPALEPFCLDPLLPLRGEFPSIDALIDGLNDIAASSASDSTSGPAIGVVGGALYLPALGRAVRCRIVCALGADEAARSMTWPDPEAVLPASPDVLVAARDALDAALALLAWTSDFHGIPAPPPRPIYFDVLVDAMDDQAVAHIAGDSFGLPLALAFLSTLSQTPLPPNLGATGAVAPDASLRGIGWGDAKAQAFREQNPSGRFLIADPLAAGNGDSDTIHVATLTDAASAISPEWGERFGRMPASAADGGQSAPPPPTGRVTFLFSDIEGSTRLHESVPMAMRQAQRDHDRIVEQTLTRRGGYCFKRTGDGFCAAFARSADAAAAAIAVQHTLQAFRWPTETGPLRPRIGIHTGDTEFYQGDYYGPALPQASRVTAAGHGGQILLSATAHAALVDELAELPATWNLRSLGRHRLRDLLEPLILFHLTAPGLPQEFPPLRSLDGTRDNLPVQATPLLGRDGDVAIVTNLIRLASTRLVTLIGPGGVGKTRLALQSAAELVESFPDGVWFVSLAEASTAESVMAAIAQTVLPKLGVTTALKDALRETRVLLVLDNFENALAGVKVVRELLESAPSLKCLATSRALLGLRGEQRFEVQPLAVPSPGADWEDFRSASAIALFCDRARAAKHDWDLTEGDVDETARVRELCRRLDGLPLAIELAAARVASITVAEILERLNRSFDILAARRSLDLPARQRTIRATLEWSYDLLDDAEQRLFRRLSVFHGSFSLEAAEVVAGTEDALDALDLLASLVDASLVVRRTDDDGAVTRYRLLALIREFSLELRGQEATDSDDAVIAHARYYSELALRQNATAATPQEVAAFDALESDIGNLRAACAWLQESEPVAFVRLILSLFRFLTRRGYWRDRWDWLHAAVPIAANEDESLWSRSSIFLAEAENDGGLPEASHARLETVLASAEARGDDATAAEALKLLGVSALNRQRLSDSIGFLDRAIALYRRLENEEEAIRVLNNRGIVAMQTGDVETARHCLSEVAEYRRQHGPPRSLGIVLNNLGMLANKDGDRPLAHSLREEALRIMRQLKDVEGILVMMENLGELESLMGNIEDAVPRLLAVIEIAKRVGDASFVETSTAILEPCVPQFGAERVAALRADFEHRPMEFLQSENLLVLSRPFPLTIPLQRKENTT